MKIYDVLYGRDTINFYLKRAITRSCVAECNSPKYKARVSLHLYRDRRQDVVQEMEGK